MLLSLAGNTGQQQEEGSLLNFYMFQDFVSSLLWPHGEGLEAAKCTTCLIGCRELSKILMVSFEVTSIEQPRTAPLAESTIPGGPGVDYPTFSAPPPTTFSCSGLVQGYYADQVTGAGQHLKAECPAAADTLVCGAGDGLPGVPRVRLRRQPPRPHLQPPLPQRHALQPAVLRVRLVVQRGLQRGECGTILQWLLTLRRP